MFCVNLPLEYLIEKNYGGTMVHEKNQFHLTLHF
jgi:hypothetical protein